MKKKQRRVFITGAAGFIGFHLAKRLKHLGDEVIGFDNFNPYYNVDLKKSRAEVLSTEGIPVIHGDVTDCHSLRKHVEDFQTTHLVHLAAQAGVRYSLENPHVYLKSNIDGFLNVLEVCRVNSQISLSYASSSSVYGLNTKIPFEVDDRTDRQASLYGVTKKTNELMAETYDHLFGIKSVGLRFFTVYGPWGRPDMAYYIFTKDILAGRPIALFNEGKMKRDFTYIDDIVSGTIAALDYRGETKVFNLGNNEPIELEAMVKILEKKLKRKAEVNYLPLQQGDVVSTFADIELSRKELGYSPKTSLSKGLGQFVDWYLSYY